MARKAFKAIRNGYAQGLGLAHGAGGQVHHAIELGVITRYGPDVFSPSELNSFSNMRGIRPERTLADGISATRGRKQLHNSAIRAAKDRHYRVIDANIMRSGLTPGTPAYRSYVRNALEQARDAIDWQFGTLFSEGRRGMLLPEGYREFDWSVEAARMLPADASSLPGAAPSGAVPDLPPRQRIP